MKIVIKLVSFVIAFVSFAMFTSCAEGKKTEVAAAENAEVQNEEPRMVIRYIDEDSLL